MKIEQLSISAAGKWARDCELLCLSECKRLTLTYVKEEDETCWQLQCEHVLAYKVISEEFSTVGYLINMPVEGAFYEILDSPWITEFKDFNQGILNKCKHYVMQFYDETVEIIAQNFIFKQLKEIPAEFADY